jgi:hypothetical protein
VSLKDLVKAVHLDLPVTPVHEKWMTENPNPKYSWEALAFAARQLEGTSGSNRLRKRMFRASGTHTCKRRQVLAYIGHPGETEQITSQLGNILATGNFTHIKWQMQGLTAGWLDEAEVPMDKPEINAGGTADGVLTEGGGFECKSINDRGYGRVTSYGPLEDHEEQTDNYMFLGDLERYSIVYENKNNGEWREFVRYRDPKNMKAVSERFDELNTFVADEKLPVILPDCKKGEGVKFRQCPFKGSCLKLKTFPGYRP